MRYNIATLAELRTFKPLRYTLDLDGEQLHLEAMLVAVGNGPSFGGGLRITEGAALDDGMLDVVVIKPMSRGRPGPDLPEAVQGHPRHPPAVRAPPGPHGHRRLAGHHDVRRRRAVRRPPAHRGVRAGSADGLRCRPERTVGWSVTPTNCPRRSGTPVQQAPGHPVVRDFSALYDFPLDDFQVRACEEIEDGRGVLVAAPTGSGKTVVGEFADPPGARPRAASASTPRRSRRCRTRSTTTSSPATAPTRSAC